MGQHICQEAKSEEEAQEKERSKTKVAPERLFHFGHLSVSELIDRLKEEHNSGLIPFHRCHRPDECFATAVGQILEIEVKINLKNCEMSMNTSACLSVWYTAVSSTAMLPDGDLSATNFKEGKEGVFV